MHFYRTFYLMPHHKPTRMSTTIAFGAPFRSLQPASVTDILTGACLRNARSPAITRTGSRMSRGARRRWKREWIDVRMIARIQGRIDSVSEIAAIISVGDISYEVLTPAVDIAHLQKHIGQRISFVTLHYLEGNASFGQLAPRLIGFIRQQDKDFFEQFITVKGIGPRRALRALTQSVERIATAINQKDTRFLTSLPEIGKRTAEQIIAELSGKVDQFATSGGGASVPAARTDEQTAAIEAMISLGERSAEAENWVDRACRADPTLTTSASIMKAAYRLKAGG